MTGPWLPLSMFGCLMLLLMSGMPVALALGGTGLLYTLLACLTQDLAAQQILGPFVKNTFENCIDQEMLISIPLFVLMGNILEQSGLAKDLLTLSERALGRLRGGLALAVLAVGTLLAASTGIVGATVVTLTVMALPVMKQAGYAPGFAAGTIAASGTLGQIIPPSLVLILLADQLNASAGDFFQGALLPGLLLVAGYALYIGIRAWLRPQDAPPTPDDGRSLGLAELGKGLLAPLLLIAVVLGSIMAGWATPTEASGLGAVGALFLACARRRCSRGQLRTALDGTLRITAMVMLILLGAQLFSLAFGALHGDRVIAEFLAHWRLSQAGFVYLVMALVFVLGCFLDFLEICFVVVPIILPLMHRLQMDGADDKLFIGVLLGLNLQTSFLSPPFGFSLFYLKGAAPSIRSGQLNLGVIPFILIQIAVMAVVWFNPQLVLWAMAPR